MPGKETENLGLPIIPREDYQEIRVVEMIEANQGDNPDSAFNKIDRKFGEVDQELENKQDTLVSGQNIKTVQGQSLLGSGNIEVISQEKMQAINNLLECIQIVDADEAVTGAGKTDSVRLSE